jgi:hypothetical protein
MEGDHMGILSAVVFAFLTKGDEQIVFPIDKKTGNLVNVQRAVALLKVFRVKGA